ncbi:MAG: LamG domain-containing protein [Patescibacteria group bacterium]|mgnify:CR=1 FL=1
MQYSKKEQVYIFLFISIFAFVFFIPVSVFAAWYNTDYQYCRKLTMATGGNSGGIATTTTLGFALVATSTISTLAATSSAGRIFEVTATSGTTTPVDVAVTSGTDCNADSGTLLDFYFEKYVQTTGEFVLWVEPTDISSTTAKNVLLYYGYDDNAASDVSNEAGTFGALGEVSVWNLTEDPTVAGAGGIADSLGTNNGTDTGSMDTADQVKGQVDGALEFDGVDDHILVADNDSLSFTSGGQDQPMSVLVWTKPTASSAGGVVTKADDFNVGEYYLNIFNSGASFIWRTTHNGTSNYIGKSAANALTVGVWNHVAVSYTGSETNAGQFLYANGSTVSTSNSNAGTYTGMSNSTNSFYIGRRDLYYAGTIDDVRVYSRALHSMDILTIYNNTRASATFWTFGAEETQLVSYPRIIRLLGVRLRGIRLR